MAKVQVILFNAITVLFIAARITELRHIYNGAIEIISGIMLLSILAFEVISVISIFRSSKLFKQQDEENLKKSARLVKIGAIPFWISAAIIIPKMNLWGIETIIVLSLLYLLLLGTSVFSFTYIKLLYKEEKLSRRKAVINTVFQFIFALDIISVLLLGYTWKYKKSPKEIARFFLGSYQPPEYFGIIANAFIRGPIPRIAKKTGTFVTHNWRAHRIGFFVIIAIVCLVTVGCSLFNFYQSQKPQPIYVRFTVQSPGTTGNPESRAPLSVRFYGSAATLEMKDAEVPAGMISINPHIEGVWKWTGDDILNFSTEQTWQIGRRYTVTFVKDFFPSHIKVDNSFNFDIEDFSLRITEREFYIDPEDPAIKRVLFTVRTNYPVDTEALERRVFIEPQINADSGSLKKQPYKFSLTYNEDHTIIYIVSEPLGMPARNIQMQLRINGGVKAAVGEGRESQTETTSVSIPGMTSYARINDMQHDLVKNDRQIYDQVLIMNSLGTIEPDELAKNITAWLLPVDRPELPGTREQKDHRWDNISEIVPEVLALSEKISLEALPNELRHSATNSWKFTAEPGRYMYVKLNSGTRFYGGYVIDEPYERIFRLRDLPKELEILSEGNILSFSGDKRLSMLSRGIREVEFNVGRIRPDDINHLVSQTSGDVSNISFRNYNFNQYNITEQYSSATNVPVNNDRDIGYFSFDFSRYLENIPDRNLRHGLFIFSVRSRDNPSENVSYEDDYDDYYYRGSSSSNRSYEDRRLIMVTDLGFFVKTNVDSSRDVFVQSIASGNPVPRATVTVLGLNGNPIFSTSTDSGGRAQIPVFGSEYRNERTPTVYTVRSGEDMSFMAYNSNGRNLDYSSFDVGGIRGATDPRALQAFLFSDRGIYRPGDEVRIGLVIKSGNWTTNLGDTPLECRVTDPRGAEIFNQRIRLSREGVEDILFSTHDWSPTGTYTASVYVIREYRQGDGTRESHEFLGSQTVKVEEFLPDTLNVSAVFDPVPHNGWISPGELKARVTVRNLFGTVAVGNEVKAQISLSPGHQYFRQHRDYQFRDPYLAKNSYQEFLGTKTTGAEGIAEFDLNLSKFERATYRLSFFSEAFEKGSGRNVSAEASVYVSPLPYLIGYKADGSLNYIERNTVRALSLIAINPQAERTSVSNLTLTVIELRYVSALVRQPNGVYKYQSIKKEYPIDSQQITIPAGGFEYRLPTGNPGEYKLSITGAGEMEFNSLNFSIAGATNIQRSLNRTAELEITMNKSDFRNGEAIQLMIKAPYAGSGLITIERDKIYAYRWFNSNGETSMQTINVPADLEGNAYVNVHYLRSQDSPEIFMSPLSYGVVPFSISRENRTNRVSLDIPNEAKPGEDFVIKYSTARRGKIIVYAVDEGILQLASYQTPDPLAFFFRKRALEVRTAQILNMVLPRYSIVQSLAAMGGGAGSDELARNLNPFKRKQNAPVAYWSGVIDSGPDVRELRYRVPDYFNGTLRVMAVSVSDSAIGAGEDRSLVRSTFVISPNAPMMAAPGDEFELSLTVTNNQKGAGGNGRVRLRAIPSEHLSIVGNSEFDLQIPEGRDQTLILPVKAEGPLGAAQIRFVASNGGESSELSAYMSIRPAVPYRVSLYSGVIKNRNAEVGIDRNLYEEFNTREVSLSYLPMGMAKGLSFFLNNFPYGCSEQITSAVFPFLYPQLFRELGYTRAQADEGINRVIGILQARMKDNGNVGMWTSRSYDDPMITVYSAHFLTEARNAGYYVPSAMTEKILQACRNIASGSGTNYYSMYTRSYAIYILTLNEIVTTPLIESLKRDMGRNVEAETGLTGLYLAGSYAMLQKTSDANTLLGRVRRAMARDDSIRYIDDLMYHSLYLNIISKHFPQRLRDISESLLVDMAEQMEKQSYTTISANHALMAINSYLKVVPTAETGRYSVNEILRDNQRRELSPAGTTLFNAPFSADAAKIRLENRDNLNLFYQITAAGFDRVVPTTEIKNGIEVNREFLDEAGRPVTSIKVGDVVTVRLSFRSLSSREYRDVAIVDLCPAGLETEIDSVRQAERTTSVADYVDIREDRIVIYGTINNRASSFSYRARAINAGSFTTPPTFAEALYDKSVWAMRPHAPIRITR
ncbi:MAG: alpha-2-macroglobulin family protein [Treponema sp.]|jgi:uncharacterized protein YfaS (alpha-2-macroglobulin family)|nr:alpha-2-macroglobulin family protein [Treponema sp.]